MVERSQQIHLHDADKLTKVNPETLKYISKYKIDMSIRGLSENTVYQYEKDLNQWLVYVLDNQYNQSVIELTDDDIEEFIYYCKMQGNHESRIRRRCSSISAFYKFLRKKKIIKESPTEFLDRPKRGLPITVQTFLTQEQVDLMREKLKEYGDLQLETYALLSLSTMARVNAIASLKWEQIDFEQRTCIDVLEKEGKIVDLFFSEEVRDLLKALQKQRADSGINDYGRLWYTSSINETTPINNSTLNSWCKTIGEMIEVPTLHPHDFRHSGATLLKNKGMDLEDISSLLHHEGTDVTKKFYIKEDTSKISALKDKFKI